ncbi:MAG: hypothetical protein KF720_21235 [Rubrivivax sp.]|nr:hypothetical protein [Rubrivivax sp.]
MSQVTIESHEVPDDEEQGLSPRQLHWLPLVIPLFALMMLLGVAAILSTA